MNKTDSYYDKIEEILYPHWRDEKAERRNLNIAEYLNREKVGKIDLLVLKQMLSHLTDHDRAVIEIARSDEKTRVSHNKQNKELVALQKRIDSLTKELNELKEEKRILTIEVNFYRRFEIVKS